MKHSLCATLLGVCLLAGTLTAAPGSNPKVIYEQIIAVVPMIGTGTFHDPKRPLFTPGRGTAVLPALPPSLGFLQPPRLEGFTSTLSDDGQSAIVQFVARDRAAFKEILAAQALGQVKVFDRHRDSLDAMLQELRKVKKNFDLASFLGGAR